MADAVTSTTIVDDERRLVIQLNNLSDGTGEAAVTKVDVSGLSTRADGTACSGVKINRIYHSVVGFTQVQLLWNATTNTIAIALAQDSNGHMDFGYFGGLQSNAAASGKTGDIKLTTIGASNLDSYIIVLDCIKDYD